MSKEKGISNEETIAELKKLCKKHGGILKPETVVNAARSVASPLHKYFTWLDIDAAEQYRIWEARQLLRVTVIFLPNENGEYVRVRAFQSLTPDRDEEGGGYRTTVSVLSNDQQRKQMIDDALAEMQCFQQKYNGIIELCEVFDAMSKAERNLKRIAA